MRNDVYAHHAVTCPTCRSPPGEPCRHGPWITQPHTSRVLASPPKQEKPDATE